MFSTPYRSTDNFNFRKATLDQVKSVIELVINLATIDPEEISEQNKNKLLRNKRLLKQLKLKTSLSLKYKREILTENPNLVRVIIDSGLPFLERALEKESLDFLNSQNLDVYLPESNNNA